MPSHSHVQGAVAAERKAAGGIVDLERGHAHVHHDAVERFHARPGQKVQHRTEASVQQVQPPGMARHEIRAAGDGGLVAVDGPDLAGRALQDGAAVAAAAKGRVQVATAVARVQRRQHLGQHHRHVRGAARGQGPAIHRGEGPAAHAGVSCRFDSRAW